jgi:hypothetical protein
MASLFCKAQLQQFSRQLLEDLAGRVPSRGVKPEARMP